MAVSIRSVIRQCKRVMMGLGLLRHSVHQVVIVWDDDINDRD